MSPILYQTAGCPYAEVAAQVAIHIGVVLQRTQLSQRELAALPWGNYERSPVLVDGHRVLEDWRAIVRYLDETYGGGALTAIAPAARARLFELCEEIDKTILHPTALLSGGQRRGRLQRLLQFLIPQKLHTLAAQVSASSLDGMLTTLRSGSDFNQTEFPLFACLFRAAEISLGCTTAPTQAEITR